MRLSIKNRRNTRGTVSINGWLYWVYLGGLCLILYMRDVVGVSVPLALFLVYFAFGYFSMDYDHSLALTAMLPLLNHGVQTNYIMIMAVVMYLYKFGEGLRLNAIHALVATLMLLELLHMGYEPFSISEYSRYLVQYMYLALIIGESRLKQLLKDPTLVLRTFIFVAVYFMLDVVLVTAKFVDLESILLGEFRFGVLDEFLYGTATLYDNENMVGMYALMAINFTAICMIKSRKHYIWGGLVVAYLIYFGLLTQSKTFVICLLLCGVLYALYIMYTARRSFGKIILIILLIALVGYLAVNVFFEEAIAGVLLRFEAEDLGTGRGELMALYNEVIMDSPGNFLFGIGLQGVKEKTGVWNTPHNGIQETVVCWGLLGLILVLCFFVGLFRRAKRYSGGRIAAWYYVPMAGYLAVIQTMQFVRLSSIFNILIPLFIVLYAGGLSDEPEKISDHG